MTGLRPPLAGQKIKAGLVLATVDPATLAIPFSSAPVISVIIPTYGQLDFTLRCLASIAQHPPAALIEVIVVMAILGIITQYSF